MCVCGLQLAEGFPEPTASVVELLNNFTGLSERSFKVATWPGQHSRAEQQALLGLCTHAHTHTRTHTHTQTHIHAQAFIHTQAQTRLSPPAADRDKSVQSDKSVSMCVCVCAREWG